MEDYQVERRTGIERSIRRIEQLDTLSAGIESLLLFGSVARNEDRPDSDVDIYVTFSPKCDTREEAMRIQEGIRAVFEEELPGQVQLSSNSSPQRGARLVTSPKGETPASWQFLLGDPKARETFEGILQSTQARAMKTFKGL